MTNHGFHEESSHYYYLNHSRYRLGCIKSAFTQNGKFLLRVS